MIDLTQLQKKYIRKVEGYSEEDILEIIKALNTGCSKRQVAQHLKIDVHTLDCIIYQYEIKLRDDKIKELEAKLGGK
ncbi:MAG: hypothetical protein MSA56_08010 [Clostridium sp.]|nr:hypothetical protein [Clostridium sp.]